MADWVILAIILLPALGALAQIFSTGTSSTIWGFGAALGTFSGILGILASLNVFDFLIEGGMRDLGWLRSFGSHYRFGVDGWNAVFLFIGSVIFPITCFLGLREPFAKKGLLGLLLGAQTCFLGLVLSHDILIMFLFWSGIGLFGFFMTALWGGSEREFSADTFFKTTSIGNALLFAVILMIYFMAEAKTSDISLLLDPVRAHDRIIEFLGYSITLRTLVFWGLFSSFCFRLPIWPIQGWWVRLSRAASAEALIVGGIFSILGATFLFLRISLSIFPDVFLESRVFFGMIGLINLWVGYVLCYRSKTLRDFFSNMAIGVTGLILLSISSGEAIGLTGAILLAVFGSFGLALNLYLMKLVEARLHNPAFVNEDGSLLFRGIAKKSPELALAGGLTVCTIGMVPGTGGFSGFTLMMSGLYGASQSFFYLGAIGMLLGLLVSFRMFRALFLGDVNDSEKIADLVIEERVFLIPIFLAVVLLGVIPKPFSESTQKAIQQTLSQAASNE